MSRPTAISLRQPRRGDPGVPRPPAARAARSARGYGTRSACRCCPSSTLFEPWSLRRLGHLYSAHVVERRRAARQLKNPAIVIRATPSMSRWPTRAIRPPTSADALTSTSVPDDTCFRSTVAAPRAKPGLPVASTLIRYDVGGNSSESVMVALNVPDTAPTPMVMSA